MFALIFGVSRGRGSDWGWASRRDDFVEIVARFAGVLGRHGRAFGAVVTGGACSYARTCRTVLAWGTRKAVFE